MTDAILAGVGTSAFGKQPGTPTEALAWTAIEEALLDAATEPGEIDAVVLGTVFAPVGTAHRVLRAAGLARAPVTVVENACASGTLAVHEAVEAVRRGRHRTVLAVGIEKMSDLIDGAIPPDPRDPDAATGLALPARYAMTAERYAAEHGVTDEQLAAVSVKNHEHALENPRAQYRGRYSVADVLGSRMIADPLTLLQCSPVSDGAAAIVVRAAGPGVENGNAVRVLASRLESGRPWPGRSGRVWNFDLIATTALAAYVEAGVDASGVDLFEVHDAFTIGEIVAVEALGICPLGRGAYGAVDGTTWRGGRTPVNPSGGLLARGHPLGATGIAQVAEVVWQLTGRAGGRQLGRARTGVVETMGGNVTGLDGNGCVVLVLQGSR